MIHIIGIGIEGIKSLSESSMETINAAKLVIGSERFLKQLSDIPESRKYSLKADLFKVVDIIKKKKKSDIVVLASGDPNLYGITGYLLKNFGKENLDITPAVSSMQWAFAMAKETWEDAEIVSAHGRGVDEVLKATLMRDKVGVFTDDKNSPDKLAAALISAGIGERKVFVCENLGMENPKMFEGSLEETVSKKFSPMNVMIIKKEKRSRARRKAVFQIARHTGFPVCAQGGHDNEGRGTGNRALQAPPDQREHHVGYRRGQRLGLDRGGTAYRPGQGIRRRERPETACVPEEEHREVRGQPGRADRRGCPGGAEAPAGPGYSLHRRQQRAARGDTCLHRHKAQEGRQARCKYRHP